MKLMNIEVEIKEIKSQDTLKKKKIICPKCRHEVKDLNFNECEYPITDGEEFEIECEKCKSILTTTINIEVTYQTQLKNKGGC